jgi:transcriptional regulator with PAS, ATPase and Fis domain
MINIKHIPDLMNDKKEPYHSDLPLKDPVEEGKNLTELVENYEAAIIQKNLEKYHGNKTATAKALGISIRNLYYKIEKYGIIEKNSMQKHS